MSPYRVPGAHRVVDPREEARRLPEGDGLECAILVQDPGVFVSAEPNPHLGREIARAANDWLIDRWLDDGAGRHHGAVVVANQDPAAAAAEIRRVGTHRRMVGVLMGSTGMGKPFGHPVYDPIHRAAVDLGLPLLVHADGDVVLDSIFRATAAGLTATHSEHRAMSAHPLMTHLTSLIAHGVFETYPSLRVLLVGGGMSWLPGFMWRFDADFKGMRRETPWVKRLPSDYLREHVRLSTYPLDTTTDPDGLCQALSTFEGMEDVLCFASGSGHADSADPEVVARCLPESWHQKVFADNAATLFGFDRT
jgi:predicted TIM-barrel fold metal-dependent hydrolase